MFKQIRIKFLNIFLGITLACIGLVTLAPNANAAVPVSSQTFGQCVGQALADYMNALIAAKASGQIPGNIKLLSPAFNMTSSTLPGIVDGMKQSGANFGALDGIAGNVYNVGGGTITQYMDNVRDLFPGARFVITETGTFDESDQGITDLARELQRLMKDGDVDGALLFNALVTNPQFAHHRIPVERIKQEICEGDCTGKNIGINTGAFYSMVTDSYYQTVRETGGSWNLEIADGGQPSNTLKGIQKSLDNGLRPIIRIGVGSDSHGFNNPQDYVAFLAQIGNAFPGQEIYAIAGPNEPDLEGWIAPQCYSLMIQTAMACGGPLDMESVSYRGEVIGLSNGGQPWQLSSALSDKSGKDDIDTIANKLTANLIIQTTANYNHPDLKKFTDNIIGEPGSLDTVTDNGDAPFHIRTRFKDKAYPGSFQVAKQAPKDKTGYGEETFEDWTKRLFTSTTDKGANRFGTKSQMPATNFIGCIQRPACNPAIEKCLKVSDGTQLCGEGDNPADCVSVGRLFLFRGEINHEEPPDLQAIERSKQNAKTILLTPSRREQTARTGNRFADNSMYDQMASANALSGYGLNGEANSLEDITNNQIAESKTALLTMSSPSAKATSPSLPTSVSNPSIRDLVDPTPASADNPETGWVRNDLSLSATENDGGTYNISYRYCVVHNSPCGIGDVSSTINGTEINIWTHTSSPQGECLQPGYGNAPFFVGVSLPFTVNVTTHGRWVGEDYCRNYDRLSDSCTISAGPDGKLTSTCGEIPPPAPLDCRNCPAWAPANLCTPIIAPSVTEENRCANGLCQTGTSTTIDDVDYGEDFKVDFDFSWLPSFITNLLGFYSVSCETEHDPITKAFVEYRCLYNNKDYLLYAFAPSGFLGDLEQYRTQDLEIQNALYKIKGRTSQYFDNPISSKHKVSFTLGFDTLKAFRKTGPDGGSQEATDLAKILDSPDDSDPKGDKYMHLGIKGDPVRTMNVEFYELFQPQIASLCLQYAFENFRGEFNPDLYDLCKQYDFVPQGIQTSTLADLPATDPTLPPPSYTGSIEAALGDAASRNGIPYDLLKTILSIEAGGNFSEATQCSRNSYTATGPFQIIDSTAESLATPEERRLWNIKRWGAEGDYTTDGRCQIDIASELAARLLRRNVGGVDISPTNKDQIIRAAEGYYGSCKPDQYTEAAFKTPNVGYCDFAVFRMGLCTTLEPSCDGRYLTDASIEGGNPSTPAELAMAMQSNKVFQENLLSNMTDQDRMQFRMAALKSVEQVMKENSDEIKKNNGKIPEKAQAQILSDLNELAIKFKYKYNL